MSIFSTPADDFTTIICISESLHLTLPFVANKSIDLGSADAKSHILQYLVGSFLKELKGGEVLL